MELGMVVAGFAALALGGAMAFVALDVIQQDRRREAARAALLAQLAFPGGVPAPATVDAPGLTGADEPQRETGLLFIEPESSGAGSRRVASLAAVSVAFALIIGAYWLW